MFDLQFAPILADRAILLHGLWLTIQLSVAAVCLGGSMGLAAALGRSLLLSALRWPIDLYVEVIRNTPFLSYYGIARAGFELPPIAAVSFSLAIYAGAHLGDIWRAAIESVPRSQWEASASLALSSGQQYRHVILPQSVRIALPPTVGFLVQFVKNTSIVSIVSVVELTRARQLINNVTFKPFQVFGGVAVIYLAICYPMSRASRRLERKLRVDRGR